MNWISIKDKLPELNKYVLIHLIDGTWPDFDIPIYQVAELRKKYNNTFRFDKIRKKRGSIGLGGSIKQSFDEYIKTNGKNIYTKSGNINSNGNGSLMRIAAIPICYFREIEKALDFAKKQSLITTQGIEVYECCRLVSFIYSKNNKSKK